MYKYSKYISVTQFKISVSLLFSENLANTVEPVQVSSCCQVKTNKWALMVVLSCVLYCNICSAILPGNFFGTENLKSLLISSFHTFYLMLECSGLPHTLTLNSSDQRGVTSFAAKWRSATDVALRLTLLPPVFCALILFFCNCY